MNGKPSGVAGGGSSSRAIVIIWSVVIILICAVAAVVVTGGGTKPSAQSSAMPSYVDTNPAYVDGFTLGGVSPRVADAIRHCPADANVTDVKKYVPCLHGVAIFDLDHSEIMPVQPFPGYTLTVNETSGDYTSLNCSPGNDTLFAAAVRYRINGGSWGPWQYTTDPSTNTENGGYRMDSEYQIALFGYNSTSTKPSTALPPDFTWKEFIPQFLSNSR